MRELWRRIEGFEAYSVSSFGRIERTLPGFGVRRIVPFVISPSRSKSGYLRVTLSTNNTRHYFSVHQLVAAAFLGPCSPGLQINHKNGIKDDNRIENLEYVTPSDNTLHTFRVLGRQPLVGSQHWKARLTPDAVREIRRLCASGTMQKDVGRMFGIKQQGISDIVRRKVWKHVD